MSFLGGERVARHVLLAKVTSFSPEPNFRNDVQLIGLINLDTSSERVNLRRIRAQISKQGRRGEFFFASYLTRTAISL